MHVRIPEAIAVAAIAGFAALVSALFTAAYTHTDRNRELDIELIKIGVGILRADPKESQTNGAREWAIRVIETNSRQPFSEEAKRQLLHDKLESSSYEFNPGFDCTYDPGGKVTCTYPTGSPSPRQNPASQR